MVAMLIRRSLSAIPLLLFVTLAAFSLLTLLPGDPAIAIAEVGS